MKLNTIFLTIGIVLSIISKILQFKIKSYSYLGNLIVIPAAICFCLAILFSIKKYHSMFFAPETHLEAIYLAALACGAITSFQIMMMLLVSGKKLFGLLFSLPFITLLFLCIKNWFSGINK